MYVCMYIYIYISDCRSGCITALRCFFLFRMPAYQHPSLSQRRTHTHTRARALSLSLTLCPLSLCTFGVYKWFAFVVTSLRRFCLPYQSVSSAHQLLYIHKVTHTYIHTYTHTYIHSFIYIHVCIYVCMYVCLYVCVYACIYTYMYVRI